MVKIQLKPGDALLIVDAQYDFFQGGALPVPESNAIIPIINEWITAALAENIPFYASRDWHPPCHTSFKEYGGTWPVHCVQHTHGAEIHHAIHLPSNVILIDKGQVLDQAAYSAFEGKTAEGQLLALSLRDRHIKRLWIAGLALDYCVCKTALDARRLGFETHVILKGTRSIAPITKEEAIKKMEKAGVILESSL